MISKAKKYYGQLELFISARARDFLQPVPAGDLKFFAICMHDFHRILRKCPNSLKRAFSDIFGSKNVSIISREYLFGPKRQNI